MRLFQFAIVCGTAASLNLALAQDSQPETPVAKTPAALKKPDPVVQPPPEGQLPRPLVGLTASSPYALLVDKSLRTMTVWKWTDDKPILVASYPTDIGGNNGDKVSEGDRRTPEGVYFFLSMREKSELNFSLYGNRAYTTDYPNYFDRLEKKTGTGIWLHAVPDTQSLWRGSKGCVVVRNKVIDQLAPYITLKSTPMVVESKVEYLSPEEWKSERAKILGWVEKWRAAWETKDIDQYISFYKDNFKSMHMNKARWKKYKSILATNYKFIKVNLENVQVFKHGDKFMFRFLQHYESDKKEDFGEKFLYVQDTKDGMGIVGEEWVPKNETNLASSTDASTGAPH
jgi:murein L,D-transpeptidase YafK